MTETPKWGKMHVAEIKEREEHIQSILSVVMLSWTLEYYMFPTISCEVHMIFEVVKSYFGYSVEHRLDK